MFSSGHETAVDLSISPFLRVRACRTDLLLTMHLVKKRTFVSRLRDVKVKMWESPLRRTLCNQDGSWHFPLRGDNLSLLFHFTKFRLLASHEMQPICVSAPARSSQEVKLSAEMKAIWCSFARVVQMFKKALMNFWAPQKLVKALNPPCINHKSSPNPLFCFSNQLLQTPSTAPSSHPSCHPLKIQDSNDFSGIQNRYYAHNKLSGTRSCTSTVCTLYRHCVDTYSTFFKQHHYIDVAVLSGTFPSCCHISHIIRHVCGYSFVFHCC